MIRYQRRILSTGADVGEPADVPDDIQGLSDDSLADLAAACDPQAVAVLGYEDTGFFPVEVPDPVVVPAAITAPQFILALKAAGKLAGVKATVNALPADDPLQVYFLRSGEFRRAAPQVEQLRQVMAVSDAAVDALFVAGAAL